MEPFRHFLINAPFPAVNEFLCAALLAGTQYFAVILQAGDISDGNVFTQRKAVFAEILKQYAEAPAQLRRVILTGICTVKQDIALGRLIETQQQLNDRGFSRSVEPHKSDRLSRRNREIAVFKHIGIAAGVPEGYIPELDLRHLRLWKLAALR